MDSVEVERAGLQKDLDEVNSEIRRAREPLDDELFLKKSKPGVVEAQRALVLRLQERRARIEANLALVEKRRPGGLSSPQAGTWSPLVLHERVPNAEPSEVPRPEAVSRGDVQRSAASSPESLSQMVTDVVLSQPSPKQALRELRQVLEVARDHVPTLRLVEAAFDTFNLGGLAAELRLRIKRLTGNTAAEPPVDGIIQAEALGPLPPVELLPDARDGLTRMQRILLSAMYASFFRADGPPKHTARLVQELQLNDPALTHERVEAALAQLTHPWSHRNPLVEVAGPLCRLTPLAEDLFTDLDKDVVDFEPGFSFKLPCILPAPIPLLLASGVHGFPPHHLGELMAAASHLLHFPKASTGTLSAIVRGPDLPSGGVCYRVPREVYERASGELTLRARIELEVDRGARTARMVITELPWPLESAELVRQLEDLRIEGVASIYDESTDEEARVIVKLEHVAFAWWVKDRLTNAAALRRAFRVQLRIDEEGEAVAASLSTVLDLFLGHRRTVVTRRLRHELRQLQQRSQELEGLLVTTELLEPVTNVLRDGDNPSEQFWGLKHLVDPALKTRVSFARHQIHDAASMRGVATAFVSRLRLEVPEHPVGPSHDYELGFSELQAKAILGTRRPSALSSESLLREWVGVAREMAPLEATLKDVRALEVIIQGELSELRARHSSPRRTQLDPDWR